MKIQDLAGQICKLLLPIKQDFYLGNPVSSIAICTLSSIDLLNQISEAGLLNKVAIAGRLFSENKGLEQLVRYIIKNPKIDTLIICGNEVRGHLAGHSLVCLYKYGIDEKNRVINSQSPNPVLYLTKAQVEQFQRQIKLVQQIGLTDIEIIKKIVDSA